MSWRDHTLRHLRLWKECLTQAVRRDLQFRSQTFTTAVTAVVDLALALVPVLILTNATAGRGGWSGPLSTAVVGAYGLGSSLIDCFVAPNLRRMDTYVRRGDLDLVLIRPVYAPLYTALRWIQPSELAGALSGAALLVFGLRLAHQPISGPAALAATAWLIVGVVAYSLFWTNLSYLSFWLGSAEPVNDIALQLRGAGQYPLAYYQRAARLVFISVIPAGLIGTMPVASMIGSASAMWLVLAGCGCAVAAIVTLLHWKLALMRYSSASS
ncbi:MAG: ABC transporter permease [Dermatophilaceae bacterium]